MREILFRGKRVDNGEWVEGSLINDGGRIFIIQKETSIWVNYIQKEDESYSKQIRVIVFEVHPETVGQFTGLSDKNGKNIFEGDIMVSDFGYGDPYEIKFGEFKVLNEYGLSNCIGFYTYPENEPFGKTIKDNTEAYLVIGNIHEL